MKYFFDINILELLDIDDCSYSKDEILEFLINDSWNNLNNKVILNNTIIDIIKNKYPKNSKLNYNNLFISDRYWQNQLTNGFNRSSLEVIVESCIIKRNKFKLDLGNKISKLVI